MLLFKYEQYNLPHYLRQTADPEPQHLQLSEAPWNKYQNNNVEKD